MLTLQNQAVRIFEKKESKIMFRKFFKYVTQSMAGMIGISIYILADTFFISLNSGAVCDRGNDRDRLCDKVSHRKIKR